jgi:hypothetical protein
MCDVKVIFVEFPEHLKTIECIKLDDALFINSTYQESSSGCVLVPLTVRE